LRPAFAEALPFVFCELPARWVKPAIARIAMVKLLKITFFIFPLPPVDIIT
jgi:hypothetical protein